MSKKNFISPNGRLSFPSLYEATSMEEGQKKQYSATLLIPKNPTDPAQRELCRKLKAEVEAVSQEKFGCAVGERFKGKTVHSPFRCGGEKDHLGGYDDNQMFCVFRNKMKPAVVDQLRKPIGEDSEDIYPGCWARVSYTIFTYQHKTKVGVSLSLGNVQKVADDERFGGGKTSAEDDFDDLDVDTGDDLDELENLDIPF